MGYIAHDAVIAVIHDYDTATLGAVEAFRSAMPDGFGDLLLGPVEGVNGHNTYVFAPDGSKEGWGHSDTADRLRDEFIEIARGDPDRSSSNIVHIRFGGDWGYEVGTRIESTTDPMVATMVANAEAPSVG